MVGQRFYNTILQVRPPQQQTTTNLHRTVFNKWPELAKSPTCFIVPAYNIANITYQCLKSRAPEHLMSLLAPSATRSGSRSVNTKLLSTPNFKLDSYGGREIQRLIQST